jgi:hypothetical protein
LPLFSTSHIAPTHTPLSISITLPCCRHRPEFAHNSRLPLISADFRTESLVFASAILVSFGAPPLVCSRLRSPGIHHILSICRVRHPLLLSPLVPLTTSVGPLPALRGTRFCRILVPFNSLAIALLHTTTVLMPFAFPSMFLHSCHLPTVVWCCCTCPQPDRSDSMVAVDLMSPSVVGAGIM